MNHISFYFVVRKDVTTKEGVAFSTFAKFDK